MGFKMKKPSIIKGTAGHKKEVKDYQELQVNRNMEQNMPDGRSMSSPFQKNDSPAKKHGGAHHGVGTDWEHAHNTKVAHPDGAKAHNRGEKSPAKHGTSERKFNEKARAQGKPERIGGAHTGKEGHSHPHSGRSGSSTGTWTSESNFQADKKSVERKEKDPMRKTKQTDMKEKSPAKKTMDDKSEGPRKVPTPAFSKTSPAKKTPKSKKQKVAEMHEKHKGKPGWQEYVDKTFGGKTTFKDGVSTTRKKATRSPVKKSVAGIVAKKVGQKAASKAAKEGTDAVVAKHNLKGGE